MISVFDLFKVGIGPSSSHTVGPMVAGRHFCLEIIEAGYTLEQVKSIEVDIYGSLALTGKGHCTDTAIILGLGGFRPQTIDVEVIPAYLDQIARNKKLDVNASGHIIDFDPQQAIRFHSQALALHENGVSFTAFLDNNQTYKQTFYSTGGGFITTEQEMHAARENNNNICKDGHAFPHRYKTAEHLLELCAKNNMTISELVLENELTLHTYEEIFAYFSMIWETMHNCIQRGINTHGNLPGPLNLPRRAAPLFELLNQTEDNADKDPLEVLDWVNLFAIAVCEENAAGGKVVTAPTNGASGIIPAILAYYNRFIAPLDEQKIIDFFLTTGAIGILYKKNASISGAEVGCQGEVGVACSMAAAGLAALLGASIEQICIAAEIGMEHNLGLTCDPVAGQVQIPCIERNAIAATKAINAARMAIKRSGTPSVSLDKVIKTMFETGKDLSVKYRETSLGGLALVLEEKSVEC